MEFAYVDESGDTGQRGSWTFTLGCVLVPVDRWFERFERLLHLRTRIRETYRVPLRHEMKANHLVGVKRIYRDLGLGDGQVRDIYQRHMRATAEIASGVFGIVIRKDLLPHDELDVFGVAWHYLLEHLRRRSEASGTPIMVIHDVGQDDAIRRLVRRFRRATLSANGLPASARLLVEDPVPRDSQHSYFIQLADLTAYAAAAKVLPRHGRTVSICDERMWQLLGPVHARTVSERSDGLHVFPSK
ncbi:DUF3800 domain-containing protein [Mycobacterium sp. M1]|uniref:DUF3800 domain-containing protein n=2 Tax=Mycolicibacter acidiphilus TaxID=2835306 RepID=A0ABS5RJB8_9MYCO|nr:DUF3800 domain-containing protein [Mycolicibacter acidiphilus]